MNALTSEQKVYFVSFILIILRGMNLGLCGSNNDFLGLINAAFKNCGAILICIHHKTCTRVDSRDL